MHDQVSRRGFLGFLTALVSLVSLAGIPLSSRAAGSKEKWIPVGKTDEFIVGQPKLIKDEKLYVLRVEKGLKAMSAKCTHLGCAVDRLADGTYVCPCHDSAFDAKGLVTKGPAKKPLVWYQTKEENGSVYVNVKGIIENE